MDIQTAPKRHHSGGGGGREDCWSESGTETLIEAWGDRYLRLNRGNLRQKDWKEVADAVNANRTGGKLPRTDIQCKNRIDTLKKKYKLEKSKPSPSKWPFFYRLEHLIGNNVGGTNSKKKSVRPPSVVMKSRPVFHPRNPSPNPNPNPSPSTNVVVYSGGSSRGINSSGSKSSEESGEGEDDRLDCVDFSEESACKELAKAILRFGEVYERIESSKQQQIMELEKQRMEFTKELEFQRMNMFMETQLELEKMKRSASKAAPNAGKKL